MNGDTEDRGLTGEDDSKLANALGNIVAIRLMLQCIFDIFPWSKVPKDYGKLHFEDAM